MPKPSMVKLVNGSTHIFAGLDELYAALEQRWQQLARTSIADHGAFHVALAGGSTPRNFYSGLAKQSSIDAACWEQTHIYFGDERCVPSVHADSNYRMANDSLLSKVPLQPEHIHAMYSQDLSVEKNVARYEKVLFENLPLNNNNQPVFDLVLLGMGDDGHTASLFPGTEILNELTKPVSAQFVEKLDAWRMSLTFPAINSAKNVAIVVAGEAKAKVLSEISQAGVGGVIQYPIQRVSPGGQLDWYLDASAAQLMKTKAL